MINVNKYKLDDESNDEDSFKNSQYSQSTQKFPFDDEKKNQNKFTSNKLKSNIYEEPRIYQQQNIKYMVDDSTLKFEDNKDEFKMNDIGYDNQNKNYFVESQMEEDIYINNNDKKLRSDNLDSVKDTNYIQENNYKFNSNKNNEEVNESILSKNINKNNFDSSTNNKDFLFKQTKIEQYDDDRNINKRENNEYISSKNINNFHQVQIIDEDVENFKRKIDILVRNFKTDSLKDFMSIKRNLLLEQKNTIESEKKKCDNMVGEKSDLIEHLKDNLQKCQKALSNEREIKEKMSLHLFNMKKKINDRVTKMNVFDRLKKYYLRKKTNKRVI